MSAARTHIAAIILLCAFLVSGFLAFELAGYRYSGLIASNIDYGYFLQFSARAFDGASQNLSINPEGHNLLFMQGAEGFPSLWRWIHFEPIKALTALLFAIFQEPLILFGFYIALFFSPLLYGSFLIHKEPECGSLIALGLLACALYPSSFLYATDYLRPHPLLPPLFALLVLALAYRRTFLEKILAMNLLLMVREEGLILAFAALLWDFMRNRRDSLLQIETLILWSNWSAWLLATAIYFIWAGYPTTPPFGLIILAGGLALGTGVLGALIVQLWRQGELMWKNGPNLLFALCSLGPVALAFLLANENVLSPARLLYSRYGFFLFYILIIVWLASLIDSQRVSEFARKWTSLALIACLSIFLVSEVLPHASATRDYAEKWKRAAPDASLVFHIAAEIPKDTAVIVDTATMPAFYRHRQVYAYDFLPVQSIQSPREYPENAAQLRELIDSGISFAVVSAPKTPALLDFLQEEGLEVELLEENDLFSFYRLQ